MAKIDDYYNIVITTEAEKAESSVRKLDGLIKKLEMSGKNVNKVIRDMDDQEFQQLFTNIDAVKKGMKDTGKYINDATISMRYLTRGLHGFRMDLLNVLFLGMSLSATFGAMKTTTGMGQVLSGLSEVFAELTVGQSWVLEKMVDSMVWLVEKVSENPLIGQILGEIAMLLGIAGAVLVPFATLTMAAGSMFGTEGLPETFRELKRLSAILFKGDSLFMKGIDAVKKLAKGALFIQIGWDLTKALIGEDADAVAIELLKFSGLAGIMSKNTIFKTLGGYGLILGTAVDIMNTTDEGISLEDALFNAFVAAVGVGAITKGKYAKFGKPVAFLMTLGVQVALDKTTLGEDLFNLFADVIKFVGDGISLIFDFFDSIRNFFGGNADVGGTYRSIGQSFNEDLKAWGKTKFGTQTNTSVTNIANTVYQNSQSSSPYVSVVNRWGTD